jgi:molybdopterin synthase sulfur carrier subunit
MAVRVLFFGFLRERAGGSERVADLPSNVRTGHDLIDWLGQDDMEFRRALQSPSVKLAVDGSITDRDAAFDSPREIAFLPPYSGG